MTFAISPPAWRPALLRRKAPASGDAGADLREILKDVEGISFVFFQARDVVRHPLVQRIVEAYDRAEGRQNGG